MCASTASASAGNADKTSVRCSHGITFATYPGSAAATPQPSDNAAATKRQCRKGAPTIPYPQKS
ncbi:Uncharacterised protein [Mycobacterium tuberculosis]|uniref:Uncharacterized protein n=1 Tax=Mycobacterium tuberculosis TaxID=1773 RepID=A0A916PBX1_MYCTX|nr:Uncharacterised protein [Mycobacterium tuberculosis]COY66340.1 Uncharacterised protein [Mycobacterium tuberculosis]